MSDYVLVNRLHVKQACAVYPSIATYVSRVQRDRVNATGLCGHMAVPIGKLLIAFKHDGDGMSNTPKCQAREEVITPFNCCCGECDVEPYTAEGRNGNRLNNPYRRAFINWVCRLADKPELLP